MTHSDFQHNQEIILRDFLALERTRLANERTLFSYIRTALYLTLGGIAFMEMEDFRAIKWLAPVCFIMSILILITGVVKYFLMKKRLKKFYVTSYTEKVDIEP